MSTPSDPLDAVNGVLSELVDIVSQVKQARWHASRTSALHARLDLLFEDARSWAATLIQADEARGVSALDVMPSVAGRTPPNLWSEVVEDDGVREVLERQLDLLRARLGAALEVQDDPSLRRTLGAIEAQVVAHRVALDAA